MSKMRPWAIWRRSIFISIFLATVGFFGVSAYFTYFFSPANCFDDVRNGSETGIDCGGSCVRICAAEVLPPKVLWVNSFKITDGQYNTVAYIDNQNQFAGSPEVEYTITLKNGDEVVAERSGTTIFPPNSVYPIFEGRIFTNNAEPITDTLIRIEPPEIWQPATLGAEQFRTRDIQLSNADVRPRLNVELENVAIDTVNDVEVVATIFNAEGEPVTASQTVIDQFVGETTEDIVFTWPNSIAKTVRSCVVPTDVAMVIDLSGSMNNDNDIPPQPLTDALSAASSFAGNLEDKDQLSLVTFASSATLDSQLTAAYQAVSEQIKTLVIAPEEETGFTNTVSALQMAADELNSSNHNPDARRVLVLLTDGLPTDPNDERAIVTETEQLAEVLNANGIEIYTIGLGTNVASDFIRNVASTPEQAHFAPNSSDLEQIYATITDSLCERGPTRIDVIAKTKTNFTPLR
jgi:Mg-chelatase subunit ChlD